jgi:hypothetical protein
MSFEAPAGRTSTAISPVTLARWPVRAWTFQLREKPLNLITAVIAALFGAYVYMAVKTVATGDQTFLYGDFHALWTSGVIAHGGEPALNYDPDALHARQVEMGQNSHAYNPFPYPPTLLLLLAPLGGLSLGMAFAAFMIPSFALYLWAMIGGRWRDWRWALGACVAPATGITLISGQSGFLCAALMIGGLRLAAGRPALAGVLFGLLAFKPQLGVLVPFALLAAGLWRTIAAACVTFVVGVVVSSLVFGPSLWLVWLHSIVAYGKDFTPVVDYMPTVQANAMMLGASNNLALLAQLCVSIPVIWIVWRAFRSGPTPQACALLLVGTFLATPHAFNYDMPMMTAAAIWYLVARYDVGKRLDVGEVVTLLLVLLLPFVMLAARGSGIVTSFAPQMLLFVLIARRDERRPVPLGETAVAALG